MKFAKSENFAYDIIQWLIDMRNKLFHETQIEDDRYEEKYSLNSDKGNDILFLWDNHTSNFYYPDFIDKIFDMKKCWSNFELYHRNFENKEILKIMIYHLYIQRIFIIL